MKRISSVLFLLVFLAFGTGLLLGQAGQPSAAGAPGAPNNTRFGDPSVFGMNYQDYFYGVISKIKPDALVLTKTKVGIPQTIRLTKKTKYVINKKKSDLAALKPGEMVYIDVKTDKKTGAMTARKVVGGMDATVAP